MFVLEGRVFLFERVVAVLKAFEFKLMLSEVLVPEFKLVLEESYLFFAEFELLSKGFYF